MFFFEELKPSFLGFSKFEMPLKNIYKGLNIPNYETELKIKLYDAQLISKHTILNNQQFTFPDLTITYK